MEDKLECLGDREGYEYEYCPQPQPELLGYRVVILLSLLEYQATASNDPFDEPEKDAFKQKIVSFKDDGRKWWSKSNLPLFLTARFFPLIKGFNINIVDLFYTINL